MKITEHPYDPGAKGAPAHSTPAGELSKPATGLEAEFTLTVDGKEIKPEALFGDPRGFVRGELMHREGTSYHLPTGGAVYFDSGVIELATPVIELERGCAARAGRSLWESILYVRDELDAWETRTGRTAQLGGFSTHYNISFELSREERGSHRTVEKLAFLLTHLLPVPVMLLAANRRSSGIGVRPRGNRIEITADFTPSPALMIAAATLITAVVREVIAWRSYEMSMLDEMRVPVIEGLTPGKHSSRQGWVACKDCFSQNPFEVDVDAPLWEMRNGGGISGVQMKRSLRGIALATSRYFEEALQRVGDPFSIRLIRAVFNGRAPALLDLDDRPESYDNVGRACTWDNLFQEDILSRSRYERVLIRAIAGKHLVLNGQRYTPLRMEGWAAVVFRRSLDRTQHILPLDYLADHLDSWERGRSVPEPA
jgi:hypothetical protein